MKFKCSLVVSLVIIFSLYNRVCFAQEKTAPPFTIILETIDGKKVSTTDLKLDKEYVILDFWNRGCKPCIVQMNTMADEYNTLVEKGIRVIAISQFPPDSIARRLMEKYQWPFEVYFDSSFKLFKKQSPRNASVPFTVIFNNKWKRIYKQRGAPVWYKNEDGTLSEDRVLKNSAYDANKYSKLESSLEKYYQIIEEDRLKGE